MFSPSQSLFLSFFLYSVILLSNELSLSSFAPHPCLTSFVSCFVIIFTEPYSPQSLFSSFTSSPFSSSPSLLSSPSFSFSLSLSHSSSSHSHSPSTSFLFHVLLHLPRLPPLFCHPYFYSSSSLFSALIPYSSGLHPFILAIFFSFNRKSFITFRLPLQSLVSWLLHSIIINALRYPLFAFGMHVENLEQRTSDWTNRG